ncbi:hypothetical protein L6164_001907 [Bauhinia variegata]|uniref:Uncharacterized protein n=1 Tax=Bauhinia variegata TaxID=167791 RepID=A0ACB9QAX3_BAUVA|nr:hypothetical protein L6164_001907 [Bauhinia variegata]
MNLEEKVTMDVVPAASEQQHLCYVRCNFCDTVLMVGIPCKRLLDTVTVKCGHCGNLSFLNTRPPSQNQSIDHSLTLQLLVRKVVRKLRVLFSMEQGFYSDFKKGQASSSSSSSTSSDQPVSPRAAPFVVKRSSQKPF